jgi:hypothetical protein
MTQSQTPNYIYEEESQTIHETVFIVGAVVERYEHGKGYSILFDHVTLEATAYDMFGDIVGRLIPVTSCTPLQSIRSKFPSFEIYSGAKRYCGVSLLFSKLNFSERRRPPD